MPFKYLAKKQTDPPRTQNYTSRKYYNLSNLGIFIEAGDFASYME
jgi:hypothetical protein